MNEILKKIEQFHGHLGPYVVIGYRMGKIANERLGEDPFSKNVFIYTGTKPPLSCIVDGIQISSGCTLGKGNLKVSSERRPKAIFKSNNGRNLEISLKDSIYKEIEANVTKENMINYSKQFFERKDHEIFNIS